MMHICNRNARAFQNKKQKTHSMSYITSFVQAEPIVAPKTTKIESTPKAAPKKATFEATQKKNTTIKILLFAGIVFCLVAALWI